METTGTLSRQRRRMVTGIRATIRHYQRCLKLVNLVDRNVFTAGMMVFSTEPAFALWLCEPAALLGGEVPLLTARTARGRRRVVIALNRLAYGVP